MTIDEILSHFYNVRQYGNEYRANCPACGDSKQHLYISHADDGKILFDCKKGCSFDDIVSAVGINANDCFADNGNKKTAWTFIREHYYHDAEGNQIAKKQIYDMGGGKKTGIWYRFENGRFIKGLNGLKPPLYHLHKLVNSDTDTVFIVEGEKDVETIEKMGFTATSSPNGAGSKWRNDYNIYFKNKNVFIITDNDEIGETFGGAIYLSVKKNAQSVKIIGSADIYPNVKQKGDITDIADEIGIDECKRLLETAMNSDILPPANTDKIPPYIYSTENKGEITYHVSCPLLAEYIRRNNCYFFINDNMGTGKPMKYWYSDGVYSLIGDSELKGKIKRYIDDFNITLTKMKDVEEVFKNITTDDCYISYSELDADENIINFQNGLLYINTMEFKKHTPNVYSTIQISCNWNPQAKHKPQFDCYMSTLTNNNKEVQLLLLQFMGVAISNVHGYRMKKALFMIGKGDSGKSQLRLLCDRLIGSQHIASQSLSTYEERFGMTSLMGKRLIGSPDTPFINARNMDNFKIITGGDNIPIEIKMGGFYSIRFNGVMWNCGNDLPKFGGDKGPHVYERFVIVKCDNVIPKDRQDKQLLDKMYAERESIIVSAVYALKKVIGNGYRYDIPEQCHLYNAEYSIQNSPAKLFYTECCCERNTITVYDNCTCTKIYDVFKDWCRDNNSHSYTPSARDFKQELADYLVEGDLNRLEKRTNSGRYFIFTLTYEAKKEYNTKYGTTLT